MWGQDRKQREESLMEAYADVYAENQRLKASLEDTRSSMNNAWVETRRLRSDIAEMVAESRRTARLRNTPKPETI